MTKATEAATDERTGFAWHALSPPEALARLESDPRAGLGEDEVRARRARHGENSLPKQPRPSLLMRFLTQLANPLVGALLLAALIAATVAFHHDQAEVWYLRYADTAAILLIVVLNALLGLFQEGKAQEALDALEDMTATTCRVVRGGQRRSVPTRELVPGDLVHLEAGDSVPADLRLVQASQAATQEAALTGESASVAKAPDAVLEVGVPLAERVNLVFLGTSLVQGTARGVVVETGPRTELGRIGTLMSSREKEAAPLQVRLEEFGHQVLVLCLLVSVALFMLGLHQGDRPWQVLLLVAVSLAVAAIPEGLPAITTITLALGMRRMAGHGAVIRRLASVETLGSATVVCSDKTGTLTRNAMTVREVWTPGEVYRVTGEGFGREGQVLRHDGPLGEVPADLQELLETAALCSTAALEDSASGSRKVLGDPTEAALLVLAEKAGLDRDRLGRLHESLREVPFDSDRKRMTVLTRGPDGTQVARTKGSPEGVLPLCTAVRRAGEPAALEEAERARLTQVAAEMAGRGFRVLALACRPEPGEELEVELVLLGFVGIIDPPRPGVEEAVACCQRAGIRVVMITGDHPRTAEAIARELGIWRESSTALEGRELASMSEEAFRGELARVAVFARVSPADKLRIVEALLARGEVPAMTGDGVNDAPALHRAPMGVSMGIAGTDVAREASDMVLLDDDFTTIVAAIEEGRTVYANIQRSVYFLLSSNAGLVLAVIGASFLPALTPLTPLQLLWINLVTNGLPALALGVEPASPTIMERPPRPPDAPILEPVHRLGMALQGALMGGGALLLHSAPGHLPGVFPADAGGASEQARTMAFTFLALAPLMHAFNCRDRFSSLFTTGILSNRFLVAAVVISASLQLLTLLPQGLRLVFRTTPLSSEQWLLVLGAAFLVVPVEELRKAVGRLRH